MASYINTNYASLQAQYNLTQSQSGLTTSIQRLSSGQRINTAADDAAGLAISDRMTAQVNGLDQAGRNANDGISLVQTADGALASIAADLQRMRQLAVQSATGTLSSADRQSVNQESQNLLAEINRVSSTTNFNGVSLLDGTFTNKNFQVGASAGQTVGMTLNAANTSYLGAYQLSGTSNYSSGSQGASTVSITSSYSSSSYLTITSDNTATTGVQIGASVSTNPTTNSSLGLSTTSAYAKAAAINAQSSLTGVSASAVTYLGGLNITSTSSILSTAPTALSNMAAGDLYINGVSVGSAIAGTDYVSEGTNVTSAINAISASTGVTATVDTSSGAITLAAADGRDINVSSTANGLVASGLGFGTRTSASTAPAASDTLQAGGILTLSSAVNFAVTSTGTALADSGLTADTTAPAANTIATTSGTTALAETFTGITNVDLTTQNLATTALTTLDAAIQQVDTQRGKLGAIQNRFQLTVNNLATNSINLQASRSRIRDTDFAATTASLSQSQILQQAGTAMLTQANTLPNSVLALLKG
jgi:flagellin